MIECISCVYLAFVLNIFQEPETKQQGLGVSPVSLKQEPGRKVSKNKSNLRRGKRKLKWKAVQREFSQSIYSLLDVFLCLAFMFEQPGLQIEYFISLQKERAHHYQIANVKKNGSWTEMSRANSPTTE